MTKANKFKALAVVAAMALALCLLALVAAHPAQAAFPGKNGKIAFVSNRDVGAGEIYTIGPSGGAATRITFPTGGSATPAYSPDGSKIAFMKGNHIFVMNANGMKSDGTGATQITPPGTINKEPTWSPDGTKIAYVVQEADYEIYIINADGTGSPQRLTDNSYPDTQPAWSPLGDQIAFVSAHTGLHEPIRDSNLNIYIMDANPATNDVAASLTPNTTTPVYQGHDEDPSWSPDGQWIAYSNGMSGVDIWKVRPNGADKAPIAAGDDEKSDPAWSPDGTKIAYAGATSGTDRDIWVMNADGSNPENVHDDSSHDVNPDWQPNSAPTIMGMRPVAGSGTRDRTPAIAATVSDKQTDLSKANIALSLNGNAIPRKAFSYNRATDRLSYTPASNLSFRSHAVQIAAHDEMNLTTIESWSFKVVR